MYELLKNINGPSDLKKLKITELNQLSEEIREALFNRLSKIGGHFGSNFGFVEPTIALHYVFNSPIDKFVFATFIIKYFLDRKEKGESLDNKSSRVEK